MKPIEHHESDRSEGHRISGDLQPSPPIQADSGRRPPANNGATAGQRLELGPAPPQPDDGAGTAGTQEASLQDLQTLDIPIGQLRPLRQRKVRRREYSRILASVKAVGLIEPVVVYPDGEDYVILDGVQRYRALLSLGVEVVPCVVGPRREAFTSNRMVNRVSPVQETRMIEKSLEALDERTIAAALGMSRLNRISRRLIQRLHAEAAGLLDQGKITRTCATELTLVKPERQKEILNAMEGYKDYTVAFARALILKTPPAQREAHRRTKNDPWNRADHRRNDLLRKLAEAEQKHDFYSRLYKQYTIDLLRLAIYARTLLTNDRIRPYLDEHHAGIVASFESIIAEAKG